MSETLTDQRCEACRADAPHVTDEEFRALMPQIPEWAARTDDNILKVTRLYTFDNFVQALAFTNRVGELAESEGHHPEIITEWGKVQITWWTHKIKGLHKNDLIMAAKTDTLYC